MATPSESTLIAQTHLEPPHRGGDILTCDILEVQRDIVMQFDSGSAAIKKGSYLCPL